MELTGGIKLAKTDLYLAYGSNLNLDQMKYRCPTARVIGKSKLENYKIVFRGTYRGGVATIEKCEGFYVPVLIWKITSQDEKSLDVYEGWPRFYRKEYFSMEFDGKFKKVMAYIMNEGHPKNYPSRAYLQTILDGYTTANFDKKVLSRAIYDLCKNDT